MSSDYMDRLISLTWLLWWFFEAILYEFIFFSIFKYATLSIYQQFCRLFNVLGIGILSIKAK